MSDNNQTEAVRAPEESVRAAWQAAGLDTGALQSLRAAALAEFTRSGFPTTKQESWKYTNVRRVAETLPGWLNHPVETADAPEGKPLEVENAIRIVLVDGVFAADLSDTAELPPGVLLADLAELQAQSPDRLSRLGELANPADSGFVALNGAFAGNGVALLVDDNLTLEQPVFISYRSSQHESVAQPRLLAELGRNASATIVEHYCSDVHTIVNPVAELFCAAGSQLTYYKLQDEDQRSWHMAAQYAAVAENATLRTTHVDVGGALARNELKVNLQGRGAHAETRGLFMTDDKRHVEARLDVNHLAPDTTSRERYRGILAGLGKGVFNGRIYVHQDAQKTAAELTNRNLLLSKGAEINTKPELEIYADDVKCAHGSTTGQLDSQSMFYLLTRGVDPVTARNMLITAFASELLVDITVPAIAERARAALESLRPDENNDG
ncbi:MAG: Fe-S cluster assembly protein SufD [Gammaproteobacteria bacterium]|nr:Fe-S cluster assembly protein SufD [Gammaproteobacteria bacterium]